MINATQLLHQPEQPTIPQGVPSQPRPLAIGSFYQPVAGAPAQTRRLFVGERLRRGDCYCLPERGWIRLPTSFFDDQITSRNIDLFARPVRPDHQVWYVDFHKDGRGDDYKGNGSWQTPFRTLEGAQARIEALFLRHNRLPCGFVMAVEGIALVAYEPPEPPVDLPSDAANTLSGCSANSGKAARSRLEQVREICMGCNRDELGAIGHLVQAVRATRNRAFKVPDGATRHTNDKVTVPPTRASSVVPAPAAPAAGNASKQ